MFRRVAPERLTPLPKIATDDVAISDIRSADRDSIHTDNFHTIVAIAESSGAAAFKPINVACDLNIGWCDRTATDTSPTKSLPLITFPRKMVLLASVLTPKLELPLSKLPVRSVPM